MLRAKKGFTLIELIIVVIIIGILAAIAMPMMQRMKGKTICAEAVTALGTIRNAVRQYYVQYNNYPMGWLASMSSARLAAMGFSSSDDLTGVYFDKNCYQVSALAGPCVIDAYPYPDDGEVGGPAPNNAVKASEAQNILDDPTNHSARIRMEVETGNISQANMSQSGY